MPYTYQILTGKSLRVKSKPERAYRPEGMTENCGICWGTLNVSGELKMPEDKEGSKIR